MFRKWRIYDPKCAKTPRITAAKVMARKLTPTPEAVLASGVVGTEGLDEIQVTEGAEEGRAVIRELFASHTGTPEGAGAVSMEVELVFAASMTEVKLAGISDGKSEDQPAGQADGPTFPLWTDTCVVAATCAAGSERLVCAIT